MIASAKLSELLAALRAAEAPHLAAKANAEAALVRLRAEFAQAATETQVGDVVDVVRSNRRERWRVFGYGAGGWRWDSGTVRVLQIRADGTDGIRRDVWTVEQFRRYVGAAS